MGKKPVAGKDPRVCGSSGRTADGKFDKGHPRYGGRTALSKPITEALRELNDPHGMARFLVGVVNDKKAPLALRLKAAEMILDRLEGRPVQATSNPDGSPLRLVLNLGLDDAKRDG